MTTDVKSRSTVRAPAPVRSTDLGPAHIEQLMAAPIPGRPQITVLGDDAVTGINPAPARPA